MKITKRQLRRIIKEEINRISEQSWGQAEDPRSVGGAVDKAEMARESRIREEAIKRLRETHDELVDDMDKTYDYIMEKVIPQVEKHGLHYVGYTMDDKYFAQQAQLEGKHGVCFVGKIKDDKFDVIKFESDRSLSVKYFKYIIEVIPKREWPRESETSKLPSPPSTLQGIITSIKKSLNLLSQFSGVEKLPTYTPG